MITKAQKKDLFEKAITADLSNDFHWRLCKETNTKTYNDPTDLMYVVETNTYHKVIELLNLENEYYNTLREYQSSHDLDALYYEWLEGKFYIEQIKL